MYLLSFGITLKRAFVPEKLIKWSEAFPEYMPKEYTAEKILDQPVWADQQDPTLLIKKINKIDNKIDRRSHLGEIKIVDGRPQNIVGRTGISGRGILGKWGPNHAADPVVTRWMKDSDGHKVYDPISKRAILQFVSIQRLDTGEWA